AIQSQVTRVNLMTGDIMTLDDIIYSLQKAGKQVYVHLEMVNGIGRDSSAVRFMAEHFQVDGIISTKSNTIAAAKNIGIRTIQRFFAIDTAAVDTAMRMVSQVEPDELELMPGLMPRVITGIKQKFRMPLIVGGLIRNMEEIQTALAS